MVEIVENGVNFFNGNVPLVKLQIIFEVVSHALTRVAIVLNYSKKHNNMLSQFH